MILHLKSPNVICMNQQSDLLMYSSGLFQRHIIPHIKMEGTPARDFSFNTIKYTKNRLFSAALHPLLQNGSFFFYLFRRIDAFFKDFLFCYVRYYLSLVRRKSVFGGFGQLRFDLVCSATDVIEIRCIILCRQGTTKTLISLCRCTG